MVSRKSIGTKVWIYLLVRNRRSKLSHPPLVHPQLQFIIHMHTSVDGEQLLSQLFRCVPDRQWLFRYGRVPVHFILATRMWEVCITLSCKNTDTKQYQQRLTAPEGKSARCKLSIISQSTTDLKECVTPKALQPYSHHFHPDTLLSAATSQKNTRGLDPRRVGTPHVAVSAVPLPNQVILFFVKSRRSYDTHFDSLFDKGTSILGTMYSGSFSCLAQLLLRNV